MSSLIEPGHADFGRWCPCASRLRQLWPVVNGLHAFEFFGAALVLSRVHIAIVGAHPQLGDDIVFIKV
jgi:hypothetical protein